MTLDDFLPSKPKQNVEEAIEQANIAKQNAAKAKNELEIIKYQQEQKIIIAQAEANATITKAKADATAKLITAEAQAQSIKEINAQLTMSSETFLTVPLF